MDASSQYLASFFEGRWEDLIDVISVNYAAVYEGDLRNNGLVIHQLCKLITSPVVHQLSNDELSDDDDEEDEEDDDDDDDETENDDENYKIFEERYASRSEKNAKIYQVAQLMITVSHSLGPIEVDLPYAEDENNNETVEENRDEELADEERAIFVSEETINEQFRYTEAHDGTTNRRYYSSILCVPDEMGKTPLHVLCENSCDFNMMRIILESTLDVHAPTARCLILAKDSRGCTPLHYIACSRQCTFSSLKFVLDHCTVFSFLTNNGEDSNNHNNNSKVDQLDPTLCIDDDGDTPLHWAMDSCMSSRRIKELTRYSLGAITVINKGGQTPLDQLAANFTDDKKSLVWKNFQSYLLVIRDNYNRIHSDTKWGEMDNTECSGEIISEEWSPLHLFACSPFDFPSFFTDLALRYCKNDLQEFDSNGMLPLHLVCARNTCNMQQQHNDILDDSFVTKMLNVHPRGNFTAVKNTGRLPIHLAVSTKKSNSFIAALTKTYPKSIIIPDPVTKLWPFALANDDNCKSISISYTLLRTDPSILQQAVAARERKMNGRMI